MKVNVDGPGAIGIKKTNHTLEERAELIALTPWVDELDWKHVLAIAQYVEPYEAIAGSRIVREGDLEAYMGFTVTGSLEITKRDKERNEKAICTIGAGKTFGEMSLIDGEPRSASVYAKKDTLLFILTKPNFAKLGSEYPIVGMKILYRIAKQISQRLRQTSGRLIDHLEA